VPAIAGRVSGICAFRDDALEAQLASLVMEGPALSDLVIGVVEARARIRQQTGQPCLALDQRLRAQILAVEMQKIERKKTSAAAFPLSDANWIMLKEVTPSGRTPHNSPSR
jgi:hypothetical protein